MGSRRDPETGLVRRGCSNGNARGNNKARRQRKEWVLETYPADRKLIRITYTSGRTEVAQFLIGVEALMSYEFIAHAEPVSTTRCYRCGTLLWYETLTIDCIFPRALGGIYGTVLRDRREKRTNLRPACGDCNSFTGGPLATLKKPAKVKESVRG